MLWKGRRESSNVEDARGSGGSSTKLIGGGIGAVIIIVIALLTGKDPSALMSQLQQNAPAASEGKCASSESMNKESEQFVRVVLASTEDVWKSVFAQNGNQYREPKLQIFCGTTATACGNGSSAMGPFYCPADEKAYIDLAFYYELKTRFQAPGDFAMAYVIAHEIGHHIQNLMGTSEKIERMRQGLSEAEANKLSVQLELQADFYAGVWAHYAQQSQQIVQEGDLEEALNAAHAIGDDNLQEQAQGYVVPDAFTHGTSAQRMAWFRKGFETGDIRQGNTFNGDL